jgi:NCS1 family nucleobase:cation symporter-1
MLPSLEGAGNFSWFIGAGLGALFYRIIADKNSVSNFAS